MMLKNRGCQEPAPAEAEVHIKLTLTILTEAMIFKNNCKHENGRCREIKLFNGNADLSVKVLGQTIFKQPKLAGLLYYQNSSNFSVQVK